jgi:tetratricopeptide (TPR) repeat protein
MTLLMSRRRDLVKVIASLVLLLAPPTLATSAEKPVAPSLPTTSSESDKLRNEIAHLSETVAEVRRDQLTYQIERDLLKETYSSNVQTINIIIAIVFGAVTGVVTLLGYLGLRSIKEVREEFRTELATFRASRAELEQRLGTLMTGATETKQRLEALGRENSNQDERLKFLELMEKIGALMQQSRFADALRYLEVAHDAHPADELVILLKAGCHLRLMQFDDAELAYRSILTLEPSCKPQSIQAAINNLAELTALKKPFAEYDEFQHQFSSRIGNDTPMLTDYIAAIRAARSDDTQGLRSLIERFLANAGTGTKPLGTWSFNEARYFFAKMNPSVAVGLFLRLVEFLDGRITREILQADLMAASTQGGVT